MELQSFNIDYIALNTRAKCRATGLPLKDRTLLDDTFEQCFTGKEAVDWLCDTENIRGAIAIELEEDNGEADAFDLRNGLTREQAVVLVRRLVSRGMIKHVTGRKNFSDSFQLFQFIDNEQNGCPGKLACGSDSELSYEEVYSCLSEVCARS
jgi:hypothetical protein